MGLFSSRYKALEALADTAADKRTSEQLTAAQVELSAAGLIVVPATKDIKSMADLDAHNTALEKRVIDADAKAKAAEDKANKLQAQVDKMMGESPDGGQPDTPPADDDADRPGDTDPVKAEQKALLDEVSNMEHYKMARRLIGQE